MDVPSTPTAVADATFAVMPGASAVEPMRITQKPAENDLAGWIALLRNSGVQADRIASPDLCGQIAQLEGRKIDTIICSVLDTDPSVPFNAILAETFTDELAAGVALLARLTDAVRVWITSDPDKPTEWFATVREKVDRTGCRLLPLRGDYPQTDPALMMYTLLQRRLKPGKLPTEKGAILIDAAAAIAIGKCVLYEPPSRQTPLAVRDHFQQKTYFLLVPTGIRLAEVCDYLQIHHPDAQFRAGDFLRDLWMTADTPLGLGELVIHPTAIQSDANPDPCIHCGWCLEACPTRIHPAGLLDASQQNDRRAGKRFGLDSCIECGICSYVCPTRLPLLTAIRSLKLKA
jgi:electron transport complex protein RnfC